MYIMGVVLFFVVVVGFPLLYKYITIPPTCVDAIQNQGETSIDRGGPCPLLDERSLQAHAVLWARAFRVRDGSYNVAAYIQNPNKNAGVRVAHYRFALYDSQNVLVADREGTTFLMPGTITPVFESRIDTGTRIVTRSYFEFTEPLVWERADNAALAISVGNKQVSNTQAPRITATAQNVSVADIFDLGFTAIVFDPAGNAFAGSATALLRLNGGDSTELIFSWSDPFPSQVGRIDILPVVEPSFSR